MKHNEQALVCLYNREIVDASRGRPFHCKMANDRLITVLFSNCFRLIYSAIYPPSMITASEFPPSTLAVEFCYSETRACSFWCNLHVEDSRRATVVGCKIPRKENSPIFGYFSRPPPSYFPGLTRG